MPSGKITTLQEGEDLILGCLVLGTGGGGRAERGLRLIQSALEEGLTLSWVDAEDIPDDAMTVQPYGMGSEAPLPQATEEEMQTTPFLNGKAGYPFASVDRWGDVVICRQTQNAHMLERIGKMLAVAA